MIMFGNLTIKQFAERAHVELKDEDILALEEFHCQLADVKMGMFHIFDMPFEIHCGDKQTAEKLMGILSRYDFSKSPKLRITFNQEGDNGITA